MRPLTRVILGAAAGGLLLVGALAVAASLIPEERVAALAARRAEAILGVPVRIDRARVRAFPLPTVRLTGVSVGESSDSTALAAADAVELRARILPLFRGRVVVRRLALERPRVLLEIDPDGRPNLPLLAGSADLAAAPPPEEGRDIEFLIDEVAVDDGRIGYRDLRDGAVVRLDGWSQRLEISGLLAGGELAAVVFTGTLSFDDIDARLPGVVLPSRDLRLAVEHDATFLPPRDRLEIRSLAVHLNGVALTGSGTVDSAASATGRTARLELAADGLDAEELLPWVPDSLLARLALPDGRGVEVRGTGSLRATLAGPLSIDSLPRLDGTLTLTGAGAVLGAGDGGGVLAEAVDVSAAFSLDSVVARATGRALGEAFGLELTARDPASPSLELAARGRAELGRLAALGLVPDSLGLAGAVDADVRARVSVRDPAASQASGTIQLAGVRVAGAGTGTGARPALAVPAATLRFQGGELRAAPVTLALGPDGVPVSVELRATGWIPALVDSAAPPPVVTARVEADTLDLDALLGPSESPYPPLLFARLRDRPIQGRPAGDVAGELGLAVPPMPPVDATVEAAIGLLVRNALRYHDMDVRARVTPSGVTVERARFGLMGGTVEASGRLEPVEIDSAGAPVRSRLAGHYTLSGVGAEPFFNTLTPFRGHLSGTMDLAGTVGMDLDRTALPDRETVTAAGTMALADGRLTSWGVLDAIGDRLGVATFDTLRFRDWAGSYRVTGPLVTLDETVFQGRRLDARAAGSFDLGGTMDVGATLYLTRELAEAAGGVGRQVVAAAGTDGRVPVGVRLTGPVERPDAALDLSEARTAVVARAREAAQREAREAADRVAREVADRLGERFELPDSLRGLPADSLRAVLGDSLYGLVPDSLKLPADSLAERAQEAIRDRLRRLLPRGGGGGGGGG